MKYRTVIGVIGGGNVSETARKLKVPYKTVNDWRKRGIIPNWREDHIRNVARSMGVDIDAVDRRTA